MAGNWPFLPWLWRLIQRHDHNIIILIYPVNTNANIFYLPFSNR